MRCTIAPAFAEPSCNERSDEMDSEALRGNGAAHETLAAEDLADMAG
jgi:hypothetical protein